MDTARAAAAAPVPTAAAARGAAPAPTAARATRAWPTRRCTTARRPTPAPTALPTAPRAAAAARCATGNCVNGFCCDTTCTGTCMACSAALTGGSNGTCAPISANTAAPDRPVHGDRPGHLRRQRQLRRHGQLSEVAPEHPVRGPRLRQRRAHSGAQLRRHRDLHCRHAQRMRRWLHLLQRVGMQDGMRQDSDCESASDFCMNPGASGTCVGMGGAGATCTANDQCTSSKCGVSGTGSKCCTGTCVTTGTCGATDCTGTGACNYPTGNSCGSASCTGSTLTPAGTCKPPAAARREALAPAAGNLLCNAGGTACLAVCHDVGQRTRPRRASAAWRASIATRCPRRRCAPAPSRRRASRAATTTSA